ncbi:LytTR family DNA-binding domain-containing protein [Rhabdobacter roseus]|uniref:DNA-binding LytR/AlgR family response regulator n=1 Tax=Rhabdobacter roseus TaxID=1655419 RepID=A0A840TH92_9BACT|nr:LytTR family DNA-binding domain-containing protein [Rhabdobacter roseus]MBB5282621.1 DNA-binding LytR/AlgR family response regulator [Rhabdobacter roseus]
MKVLILEDEQKAANELKYLLQQIHPTVQICGILQSVDEATAWFDLHPAPDLILSDIQLGDGLSFDILKEKAVPVIFCTAYDEYALRAFESNGIDYLLKPIEKDKLRKSLEKLNLLKELFSREPGDLPLGTESTYLSTLLVHYRGQIIPLATDEIEYIRSHHSLVLVHTHQHKYEIRETLDELALRLNPLHFFRANRQVIVQRRAIALIEQHVTRKLVLTLTDASAGPITISKAKASRFLKWMKET